MARESDDHNDQPQNAADAKPDPLDNELEGYVTAGAPPLSKGDAELLLAKASADATKLDERQLQDRSGIGEELVRFASRRGHVALGYPRVGPCLREHFGLGRTWAAESMRCSKLTTRDDLVGLTWTQVRLGMRLTALLEVASFGALKKRNLPAADGATVRFPAPPDVLEHAIALLEAAKKAKTSDPVEPRAAERTAQRRAQAVLDDHLARDPALAEAKPVVYVHHGPDPHRLRAPARADAGVGRPAVRGDRQDAEARVIRSRIRGRGSGSKSSDFGYLQINIGK